jgi:hypothetical protein
MDELVHVATDQVLIGFESKYPEACGIGERAVPAFVDAVDSFARAVEEEPNLTLALPQLLLCPFSL